MGSNPATVAYMSTLAKSELAASISHIARILKSGTPIYYSEDPDTAGRKTRRTQAIAKRFCVSGKRNNP